MNNTVLLVHYLTKADLAGLPSSWIFHMVPDVSGPFLWALGILFLKGFSNLTVKGTVESPTSKYLELSIRAYTSLDLLPFTGHISPIPSNWWQ